MHAGRGLRAPASRERGRGLAKAGRARRRLGNARASAGPGRASLLLVASEAEGLARRSCGGVSGCWYRACRGHPLLVMRGQAWGRAVRRRVSGEKSRGSDVGGELGLRRFRKSWRLLFFPFSLLLFMYEGGQEGSCLGPPPLFFFIAETQTVLSQVALQRVRRSGRRGFGASPKRHTVTARLPNKPRPQLAPSREKRERPGGVDSATGTLVRDPLWIT